MSKVTAPTVIPDVPLWLVRGDTQLTQYVATLCVRDNIAAPMARTQQLMQQHGCAINKDTSTITEKHCQLHFNANSTQAWQLFQQLLIELGDVDIAIQPMMWQPKQLLICDMDKTIVDAETLDEVAEQVGIGQQVAQITEQAMHGEIDFHGALRQRIKLLAGQQEHIFHQVMEATPINPGATALITQAKMHGITTILISGGFAQVAQPIARRLGFDAVYCNQLEIKDEQLTGKVIEPIVDGTYKRQTLLEYMDKLNLQPQDCCAIGDGANDIPMLKAAGLGIAFQGKPLTQQATAYRIDATDLGAALHFMGL